MYATKNFSLATDPKLACTCGHPECDKRMVKPHVMDMNQQVRDMVKRPLVVTSGGRCPHHKSELHRTVPADHQKGQGTDFRVRNGLERGQLVTAALEVGFNAIGVAKTFVHLGYRPELAKGQIIMWTYD